MLEFDAGTHTYTLDGAVLPSVTRICRYLSVDVAENARSWLRDAAAARGREVHELCADIDYGAEITRAPAHLAGYVAAWLAFERDYGISGWIMVEHPIASASLGVAGTVDRLGKIGGRMSILDIKTGAKADHAQNMAQMGGYNAILRCADCEARIETPVERYFCVKLAKDGKYTAYEYEADTALFYALQMLDAQRKEIQSGKYSK